MMLVTLADMQLFILREITSDHCGAQRAISRFPEFIFGGNQFWIKCIYKNGIAIVTFLDVERDLHKWKRSPCRQASFIKSPSITIRDRFGLVVNWFEWLPSRSIREARSLCYSSTGEASIRNNAFVLRDLKNSDFICVRNVISLLWWWASRFFSSTRCYESEFFIHEPKQITFPY